MEKRRIIRILSVICVTSMFFPIACLSTALAGWTNPAKINGTACSSKWPGTDASGSVVTYLHDDTGSYDDKKIMVVEYANGTWQTPIKLAENGHYSTESVQWLPWETRPVVSGNGKVIVYVGGYPETVEQGGNLNTVINPQIYISEKSESGWSTPSRLDVGISRVHHILSISDDGNTLAFSSAPANIFYESPVLYIIRKTDGKWGTKITITEMNSGGAQYPSLSGDGKKLIWIQNNKIWFSEEKDGAWTAPIVVVDAPLFNTAIEYPRLNPDGNILTFWKFPIISNVLQPGHLFLVQRTPTGAWTQPTQITKEPVTPSFITIGYAAGNALFSRQVYSRSVVSEDILVASNIEVADLTNAGWQETPVTSDFSGFKINTNPVLSRDGRTLVFQGAEDGCSVLKYSKASDGNNITMHSLSGRVLHGERPVKGASIELRSSSRTIFVETDASGNFGFAGLTDGTYTIAPKKVGYVFDPEEASITISGQSISSTNFLASPAPGTIIFYGLIADASLRPINTIFTIELLSDPSISTKAEPDGTFVLAGIPAGKDFQLKIVPESGFFIGVVSATYKSEDSIIAPSPFIIMNQNEHPFPYWVSIMGKVITRSGTPIEGASISCKNLSTGTACSVYYFKDGKIDYSLSSTAANGIFFCTGFQGDDQVLLEASKEGYTFEAIEFMRLSDLQGAWQKGEGFIIGKYEAPPITSLEFKQGWNFVSFPRNPPEVKIESFLSDIGHSVKVIWGYESSLHQWEVFGSGRKATEFRSLNSLVSGKGYWVYVDAPFSIEMSSWKAGTKALTLNAGWNLIGWNGQDGKNVMEALRPLEEKWIVIWGWDNGMWKARHSDGNVTLNFEPLDTLNQGKAYWIKMKGEAIWEQE